MSLSNSNKRNKRPTLQDLTAPSKACYFCINNTTDVDYKNVELLRRFTSSYGKIMPRRKSAICASHQRQLSEAIKRARFMALLPYLTR